MVLQAKFKYMHDHAFTGGIVPLQHASYAVVPASFVRLWTQWLIRPTDVMRPDTLDNSGFFCEHGMLNFDPNIPVDIDSSMAIIRKSEWENLEQLCALYSPIDFI